LGSEILEKEVGVGEEHTVAWGGLLVDEPDGGSVDAKPSGLENYARLIGDFLGLFGGGFGGIFDGAGGPRVVGVVALEAIDADLFQVYDLHLRCKLDMSIRAHRPGNDPETVAGRERSKIVQNDAVQHQVALEGHVRHAQEVGAAIHL